MGVNYGNGKKLQLYGKSTIPYCFYSVLPIPYWKTIVSARVHYKNSKELWNDL